LLKNTRLLRFANPPPARAGTAYMPASVLHRRQVTAECFHARLIPPDLSAQPRSGSQTSGPGKNPLRALRIHLP